VSMRSGASSVLQEFRATLGARDPKTVATYLTTMRDFVAWLAAQPGGTPFHLGLVTETAEDIWIPCDTLAAHLALAARRFLLCAGFVSGR
jgi:hypothetical protein